MGSAHEDAAFYNARRRQVQISKIFFTIDDERISLIERRRQTLSSYVLATTRLALLVIALAAVIFRQLRRLQRAEGTISAINQALQENNANLSQFKQHLSAANSDFNELLKPEERIQLSADQLLLPSCGSSRSSGWVSTTASALAKSWDTSSTRGIRTEFGLKRRLRYPSEEFEDRVRAIQAV